jgi:drug/metabolite transporter (DMT)-like permease
LSSRAWLLLLSLSLIWGASFYFIEIGLIYLDPFWLVSVRLISGALALVLWLALNKIDLPNDGQFWLATAIMGVFNNVIPFILIAYGQQYVTGGLASIINANTAFISIIVSGIFVASEPAKWHRIVGVLIGICGIAIAIGIDDTNPHKTSTSELIGELAIVLATVSYAFAAVWGKLRLTQYKPIQGATGMLICSAVVAIFCSVLISGPPEFTITDHPIDLFKLIVGLGVLGTAAAYPLYFRILDLAGSSNLMLVTIIVPVFAVVLDAALLGQFVTSSNLMGFAVVSIGLLILDGRIIGRFKGHKRS